jgi:nucleoside-diphosphate kinase
MPQNHKERTLIAIKPESIQRHLIGEFIQKFEHRGLKLVAMKLIAPTKEQVGRHYPDDDSWYVATGTKTLENFKAKGIDPGKTAIELAKEIRNRLMDHLTDRAVIFMIWEGPHACALGRKTAGATNPLVADIGSIRGDYSMESYELADNIGRVVHTLIHASGSPEEAEQEIKIWFSKNEILSYDLVTETVLYTKDWGKVK